MLIAARAGVTVRRQEAFRLPQRNGLQGRELVEAARACEIRFAYTIAGRFRSVKLPDEPAAGGLLQPREAAGVKALRQRLFRAPQDGGKHGIGAVLPVPPACSSAAPGTCVKQAEKSASIKEASYKVSYSAELSPSSSSAASVPTAA